MPRMCRHMPDEPNISASLHEFDGNLATHSTGQQCSIHQYPAISRWVVQAPTSSSFSRFFAWYTLPNPPEPNSHPYEKLAPGN